MGMVFFLLLLKYIVYFHYKKDVMQTLLQSGKYSYFDLINFNKNYAKSVQTDSVEFLENFLRLKNRI